MSGVAGAADDVGSGAGAAARTTGLSGSAALSGVVDRRAGGAAVAAVAAAAAAAATGTAGATGATRETGAAGPVASAVGLADPADVGFADVPKDVPVVGAEDGLGRRERPQVSPGPTPAAGSVVDLRTSVGEGLDAPSGESGFTGPGEGRGVGT